MERDIVVCGVAQLTAPPDLAALTLTVEVDADTQDAAYADAAVICRRLDDLLGARADAVTRVSTAQLAVLPRMRWQDGESVRAGWRAVRSTEVQLTALGLLGELIAQVTKVGAALTGLHWHLEAGNPVHAQVRRLAAQDARARAQDYAAALGLSLGSVAWVAEPGLRLGGGDPGGRFGGFSGLAKGMALESAAAGEPIEVAAQEIVVTAALEVGFGWAVGVSDRSAPGR